MRKLRHRFPSTSSTKSSPISLGLSGTGVSWHCGTASSLPTSPKDGPVLLCPCSLLWTDLEGIKHPAQRKKSKQNAMKMQKEKKKQTKPISGLISILFIAHHKIVVFLSLLINCSTSHIGNSYFEHICPLFLFPKHVPACVEGLSAR